jgi:transposase-like protein
MTLTRSTQVDRRSATRLANPSCPRCGNDTKVIGFIRTTQFVYFRCAECDELLVKVIPQTASTKDVLRTDENLYGEVYRGDTRRPTN